MNAGTFFTALFSAILFFSANARAQVIPGKDLLTADSTGNREIAAFIPHHKLIFSKHSNRSGGDAMLPHAIIWIGVQQGLYQAAATVQEQQFRIPLVPRPGSAAGYDSAGSRYIIREDGYYRIHSRALVTGAAPGNSAASSATLQLYPDNVFGDAGNFKDENGSALSVSWEGYIAAGTAVAPAVIIHYVNGIPQNVTISKTFMSVTRLYKSNEPAR